MNWKHKLNIKLLFTEGQAHTFFLNSSAMFLTKLLSSPNCLIFSSNYLILSWAYIAMSNLFSKALYLTISSLMSSYFYDTFLYSESMSKFLLFNFS